MLMLAAVLMIITIVGVAAFQGYWLRKLYLEEWSTLKRESDIAFRDIIYQLQVLRHGGKGSGGNTRFKMVIMDTGSKMLATSVDALKDTFSGGGNSRINILRTDIRHQPIHLDIQDFLSGEGGIEHPMIIRYITSQDSIGPPVTAGDIHSAYQTALLKFGITVPFRMERVPVAVVEERKPIMAGQLKSGYLITGPDTSVAYQASFDNPFPYIIRRLRLPITVGVLLLAFTTLSLIFLYRNLVQQRQISAIKNEFISNMTHELKTPISTVTVAVEALRHFGALEDPAKTREYLDISALELQRLSLLVDKVLKLSLFENRQIELKPERIDVPALVAEVMASMKLSFEKAGAVVQLNSEGDGLFVRADRMHLASVISNLLDNALKYSRERPVVGIVLSREGAMLRLAVTDNGIGIPPAYREKVFEKFFRVPSGDHHNIKGYGLGLSYVHHIVTRHEGQITVDSKEGRGSTFIIQLPAA
jgi:two-component system phosphate regulon sensor histidine kinase PhoR